MIAPNAQGAKISQSANKISSTDFTSALNLSEASLTLSLSISATISFAPSACKYSAK